jgi:hypothetical protein
MRRFPAAVLLFALALPATAGEDASLEQRLAEVLATADPAERLRLAMRVLQAGADPAEVATAVPRAWRFDPGAVKGEPVWWSRTTPDRVERTVYAYAPAAYTPERAWPLLVWLHGGVSQAPDGAGRGGVGAFQQQAEARGFLILSPSASGEAAWWRPAGTAYLRRCLEDMTRRYRVDPDRVAVAGFSDGASACFHLLAHDPEPYACFLAFMGNPLVTRLAGGPTWDAALAARPLFAVNGARDALYPAEAMRPLVEEMQAAGARLTWVADPDAAHEGRDLFRHWEDAWAFWQAHPRDPLPRALEWATSRPAGEGRLHWVEILETGDRAAAADGPLAPRELVANRSPRPRLGIRLDTAHPGPGLAVESVEEGSPAAEADFRPGDVVVEVGGEPLGDPREAFGRLRAFLDRLGEEGGEVVLLREGERIPVRAQPRALPADVPARPADLGYDQPAGRVRARVLDDGTLDVRTFGVARLRLHLAAPLVDFDRPLRVVLNGRSAFEGRPPASGAHVVAEAIRGGPGNVLYRGSLDLDVPPPDGDGGG